MTIGIGCSDDTDSARAAWACADQALSRLQGAAGFGLAFCGGRQNPGDFLAALRQRLGQIPIIGGNTGGAMAPGLLGTSGFETVLLLLPDSLSPPALAAVPGLDRDERETGRQLGRALLPHLTADSQLLLFFDSIKQAATPPRLHVASYLLDGLHEVLESAFSGQIPTLIGVGTLSDFQLRDSLVFDGTGVARHTAVAAVLPHRLELHTRIIHGCVPVSDFLEITRIDGAVLHELNGRPAANLLAERLDTTVADIARRAAALELTLGEKSGDPFAPFDERHYVNRLVVHADLDSGAIVLFEADFQVGSRVQVMLTDADAMYDSVAAGTRALLAQLGATVPLCGTYIDCIGRASAFSGAAREEADAVRQILGERAIPWMGIYSGVEIAPWGAHSRPLDWTGVLSLWSVRAA